MDSNTRIISNLQDVVGCSGLRSLKDLGLMRLMTVRGRVSNVEKKLPIQSIISIFIAWLQAKAMQVGLEALPLEEWCRHLSYAYGCTESEVLWYWDSSERLVWDHVFTHPSRLSDVRRRMGDVCRAVRQVFARQRDACVPVHVREESQRQRQTSYGSYSWRPSDDSRREPAGDALRRDRHEGDLRDISPGRVADKTDGNTRSASSVTQSSSKMDPARRGENDSEQIRHRHQTTVHVEKLPVNGQIKNDRTIQENRETDSTPVKPGRNDHCSPETSKSDPPIAPRDKLQEEDIQDIASPQKPGLEIGLALRPHSAPSESWPSNNSNGDYLVKRGEYQMSVKGVAEDMKELSAADEVALQCADEFLCRLGHALKRKYQSEVKGDLMFWDDKLSRKRPKLEAVNEHSGDGAVRHVNFFDSDVDADGAYIPCPASATRTEPRESDASPSERMLSGLFRNRNADKRHEQKTLVELTGIPAVQEPRRSAIELWQAGIEFRAEKTSEEDG
ncbi:hypothetical protein E4U21_004561 [Claviceps maximensis]|nr:hypothetical protein E4U21_004561 [Claviceps maximensis]